MSETGTIETALVPIKKSSAELIKDLAKSDGNNALVAVFDRMTHLEAINSRASEILDSAQDLIDNYLTPGPKRFRRVVRLRRALDSLRKIRKY